MSAIGYSDTMTTANTEMQVRSPYQRQGIGAFAALAALWQEIVTFRWHIGVSFAKGFAAQSQLTRLGVIWNYVLPLVPISVYSALMALRLFPSFGNVSGLVYIAIGVTLWFYFSGLVRGPIDTTAAQIRSISKTGIPLSGSIVASFAQLAFETTVRLAAVVVVFALLQGVPAWQVVLVPIPILFGTLLFLGLGLMLAMLNIVYRDVSKLIGIALQYGIFLSGVIFPIDQIPALSAVLQVNPFFIFIESVRSLAVLGTLPHPIALAVFSALGVAVFLLGVKVFYMLELRFRGLA
jgi:ABC-type polysaccharide/polyol phosphate export permease